MTSLSRLVLHKYSILRDVYKVGFCSCSPSVENIKSVPSGKQTGNTSNQKKKIYVWGCTSTGALGIEYFLKPGKRRFPRYKQKFPANLRLDETEVLSVAAGYGYSVFVTKVSSNKTKVYGTGVNTDAQIGFHPSKQKGWHDYIIRPSEVPLDQGEENVIKASCGRAHTLLLTDSGSVLSLGHNGYGQCGRQIVEKEVYRGNPMIHRVELEQSNKIVDVACGADHSLFLTSDRHILSCGWGADGQTGRADYETHWRPAPVKGDVEKESIVKISTSAECCLALNDNGEIFGWGNSEYSQLASITEHTQVNIARKLNFPNVGKVIDIAVGGSFCCLLNDEGTVFVWGYGVLGLGPQVLESHQPHELPPALLGRNELSPSSRVCKIFAGLTSLAAITEGGDVYTWGLNSSGQLGLGHRNTQFFPLRVALPAIALSLSLGPDHSLALCKTFV